MNMETISNVVRIGLWVGLFASLLACWVMMLSLASKNKAVAWVVGLAVAHLIVLPFFVFTHWQIAKRRIAFYLLPIVALALIFPATKWHHRVIVEAREKQLLEDPNNARVLQELGSALITLERPKEALPYLERAVRIDPKDFKSVERLSFLYMETGQFSQAAGTIADALPFPERSSRGDANNMYCRLERSLREIGESDRAKRLADALEKDQITCVDGH